MASSSPKFPQYQGGSSFTVFTAQGSNPVINCKITGKSVHKIYDKAVKGYVYSCSGGMNSKIQFPKDENKAGLQLIQPYLVLQLFIPKGQHFSLELRATDTQNTRRKMYFSTSFSELKSTPLHCQIPLSMIMRNTWISLALHVPDLFHGCFRVLSFRSLDVIILGPVCKLRKIFTMRNRLARSVMEAKDSDEILPPEHTFAAGVDADVQVIDIEKLQNLVVVCPNTEGKRDTGSAPLLGGSRKVYPGKHVNVAFGSRMPLPLSTVQINTNLPHDDKSNNQGCNITRPIDLPPCKISESVPRSLLQSKSNFAEKQSEMKLLSPKDSNLLGLQPMWTSGSFSVQEEPLIDELEAAPVIIDRLPDLMSKQGQKLQKLSRRREEKIWKRHQVIRHSQKESPSHNRGKDQKDIKDTALDDSPPGSPPSGWDNNSNGVSDNFLFNQQFDEDISEFSACGTLAGHYMSVKGTMNDGESFNTCFQNSCALDQKDLSHKEFTPFLVKGEEVAPYLVHDQNVVVPHCPINPKNHSVSDQNADNLLKVNHCDSSEKDITKQCSDPLKPSPNLRQNDASGSSEEHWDVHQEMNFNDSLFDMEKEKGTCQEDGISTANSGKNEMLDSHSESVTNITELVPSKRSLRNEKDTDTCSTYKQQIPKVAYKNEAQTSICNKLTPPKLDTYALANNQKDKELDLLYDPILDCYYDPKTNRYYELK